MSKKFLFFFQSDRWQMTNGRQKVQVSHDQDGRRGEGTRVMHRLLSSAPPALPPAHQLCITRPFAVIIYQIISIHRFLALSPGNKTSSCSKPRQPRWMAVMVVVGGNEACRTTPGRGRGGGGGTNAFFSFSNFFLDWHQ